MSMIYMNLEAVCVRVLTFVMHSLHRPETFFFLVPRFLGMFLGGISDSENCI